MGGIAAAAATGGVVAMLISAVEQMFGAQVGFFKLVEQGFGGLGREGHLAPNTCLGTPQRLLVVKVVVCVRWWESGGGRVMVFVSGRRWRRRHRLGTPEILENGSTGRLQCCGPAAAAGAGAGAAAHSPCVEEGSV